MKALRKIERSPLHAFFVKINETPGVIPLSVGDIDLPIDPVIKRAATRALDQDFTNYTPPQGIMPLRELAAQDFREDGIPATRENTIISAGSTPLISSLFFLFCGPGVDVFLPEPGFPSFRNLVEIWGGNPIPVDTEPDGFVLTARAVRKALDDRKGSGQTILVVNSPCNPTGMVWDLEEIAELPIDIFIADQAYRELIYEGEYISLASFPGMAKKTFTIRSCSKTFSMSGLRIGYMTGPQEFIELVPPYLEVVLGWPCSLSQKGALEALKQKESCLRPLLFSLRKRRDLVLNWFHKMQIPHPHPNGALYVWGDFSRWGRGSLELAETILEKAKVGVIPGVGFGKSYDNYLRFSYAMVETETLQLALQKIQECLESLE